MFVDGMEFTESFRGSNAMQDARDFLYGKYKENGGLTNDSIVTELGYGFGLDDLVTDTDLSLAGQFIGSSTLKSATVHDGTITYRFTNNTSLQSFLYSGGDNFDFLNILRSSSSSAPTSTITQTIVITEPMPLHSRTAPLFKAAN
jgi:hypothetical protein